MKRLAIAVALSLLSAGALGFPFNDAPPNSPSQGTQTINPYTLGQAVIHDDQTGFYTIAAPVAGQANCTNTTPNFPFLLVSSAVASGTICLPPAYGGRRMSFANTSGQTIVIFGSPTPFAPGVQDTINSVTTGRSLISGQNAICFTPANGQWFCILSS